MKNRKQPIGGQRAEKQALAALPVVDELAPDGAVHPLRCFAQFSNRQLRSILAVTIGQNAIGGCRAIRGGRRRRMNGSNRVNGNGSIRRVEHLGRRSLGGRGLECRRAVQFADRPAAGAFERDLGPISYSYY